MDKIALDKLIEEYSMQLMKLSREATFSDATPQEIATAENEESTAEAIADEEEPLYGNNEEAEITETAATAVQSDSTGEFPDFTMEEPENFAFFTARVFAGDNIFAIKNAKVTIFRNDEIFFFLITDENGETKRVRLPSFAEINSLESDSKEQSLDYYADVYAEGFIPQKNLLVSAVGGSDIILNVKMTPESDEVN